MSRTPGIWDGEPNGSSGEGEDTVEHGENWDLEDDIALHILLPGLHTITHMAYALLQ